MNLNKLSKIELFKKCEEKGIKKYKSKNKNELIILIENKNKDENKDENEDKNKDENEDKNEDENEDKNKDKNEDENEDKNKDKNENKNEDKIEDENEDKNENKNKDKIEDKNEDKNKDKNKNEDKIEINKIYNEDCIIGMKKINNESVDIIICDPPYNIGKDFENDSDKQKRDDYILWCDKWITECLRILKPHGTLYIYGFSEILAFIRVRITCNVRWLIWHYTNKVIPSLNFWQRTHESILCCYKEKAIFNRDDVREPYTETFLKNAAGKVRKSTIGRFSKGDKETTYTAHENGALPRDVIKVSALAGGAGKKEGVNHPTQKPLNLCDTLIKASCKTSSASLLFFA
jgi:site-specific DNA-methyltransferase (adenine-specific)